MLISRACLNGIRKLECRVRIQCFVWLRNSFRNQKKSINALSWWVFKRSIRICCWKRTSFLVESPLLHSCTEWIHGTSSIFVCETYLIIGEIFWIAPQGRQFWCVKSADLPIWWGWGVPGMVGGIRIPRNKIIRKVIPRNKMPYVSREVNDSLMPLSDLDHEEEKTFVIFCSKFFFKPEIFPTSYRTFYNSQNWELETSPKWWVFFFLTHTQLQGLAL